RPSPRKILRRLLGLVKPGGAKHLRKRARGRESKRVGSSQWKYGSAHVPVDNLHRGLPIRLFHGTPGGKTGAGSGLQYAAQFRQGSFDIAEKHHPKAAGSKIEALIRKR